MPDPADTNSFIPVDTVSINSWGSWYSHHTVRFDSYSGPHGHVAFRTEGPDRPYIDDIILEEQPCAPAEELHVTHRGTNSLVIAWTNPGNALASWHVEYDTADFIPGTGTVVPTIVNNSSCTLTGLDSGTTYYIYIYPDCFDSVVHRHIVATTLLTSCPPPQNVSGVVSSDSLSLTWEPGDSESAWEVTLDSTSLIVDTPAYTFMGIAMRNGYTVLIRSICCPGDTSRYVTSWFPGLTFTVAATPDNRFHGTVDGGGEYYYGDTAILSATPIRGYIFTSWNDNDSANPRYLVVVCDTTLVAHFQWTDTTGIATPDEETLAPRVYAEGRTIVVTGAEGKEVSLYDMMGRQLAIQQDDKDPIIIDVPTAGTYLIRIGTHPARRVVVVR